MADAVLIGRSLTGTARLYNSVGRFYFHGEISSPQSSKIQIFVSPPKPGTLWYLIYMMMVHGQLALYPEMLFELASYAVPAVVKAVIYKRTGQDENMHKALEIIEKQQDQYHQLVGKGQEEHARMQEKLIDVIGKLADQNRPALAEMAAPVGKTVRETELIEEKAEPLVIDQPIANALTSKEDLTVGETIRVRGLITALDVNNGSFKLEHSESGERISGRITDPSLSIAGNIYSHALDMKLPLTLEAKPTLKEDGSIHRLFVSDAAND